MSSTYHIPFPRAFLAVNTPVKNSSATSTSPPTDTIQPQQPDHGFLSNRASAHPRTTSISSTVSDSSTASVGAPPSPPAAPAVASPVLGAKVFAPLAVNAKHAPLPSLADMTPVARSAFLSNRGPSF